MLSACLDWTHRATEQELQAVNVVVVVVVVDVMVVAVAMLAPVLVQPMPIRRNLGEQGPQHGQTGPTTLANKPNSMIYHGNLVDVGVATVLTFNSVINAAISACSRGATPRPLPDVPPGPRALRGDCLRLVRLPFCSARHPLTRRPLL